MTTTEAPTLLTGRGITGTNFDGLAIRSCSGSPSKFQERMRRFNTGQLRVDCSGAVKEQKLALDASFCVVRAGLPCIATLSEHYELLDVLGQGSSGVVRRAVRRSDCLDVAIKIVRTDEDALMEVAHKEHQVLRSVDHPNIVRALDFFTCVSGAVLVMELFLGTTLDAAVRSSPNKRFDEDTTKRLFLQLLRALAYLHGRRILHRDVKAQNILVAPCLANMKLVDFNSACRLADGGSFTGTGTEEWKAPELLLGDSSSELADVWSSGLCLHFMLTGRLPSRRQQPAADRDSAAVKQRRVLLRGHRWRGITLSKECRATLRRCLAVDKMFRPAAVTLLCDAWLACGPPVRVRRHSAKPDLTLEMGPPLSLPLPVVDPKPDAEANGGQLASPFGPVSMISAGADVPWWPHVTAGRPRAKSLPSLKP